jgi:predicted Zn-dependent protease
MPENPLSRPPKSMSKRQPSPPEQASPINRVLEQAVLALQMQRMDEAERLAAQVLKSNRGNIVAAGLLGRVLLAKNRPLEAIDVLQRSARRSDDPELETLLAVALGAAGRDGEAIEQLQRTVARRPPFPPAFVELGRQLSEAGRFDEGIALLEGGLALAPDHVELQMALGYLHLKRNDRASARTIFSGVREASPDRHETLVALAKVLVLDGNYRGAADLYRNALALRPEDVLTRINLGKCLLEMGERDAGESTLRAAIRSAPQLAGRAILALAAAPHGRAFLRPADAAAFLRADKN